MKDDERHLLGAAQASGEFVCLDGIKDDRCANVLKNWTLAHIVDPETGRLTAKGAAAKGGIPPIEEAIPPVEIMADATISTGIDEVYEGVDDEQPLDDDADTMDE